MLSLFVADAFALNVKTKNFHWHLAGSLFRDYHLLIDEHADQIFASIDILAERVRRFGGIHFEQGDLMGRAMGRKAAAVVWDKAQAYIHGNA